MFEADLSLENSARASLLHFIGGHVTIEGLEFELDADRSPIDWSWRRSGPRAPS